MKRWAFVLLLTAALGFSAYRAAEGTTLTYQGPLPPPTSGYGSWGPHPVSAPMTFTLTAAGYTNTVALYPPADQTSPAPTLFFAPGWNVPCEGYETLLQFIASQGYVAVCDDYHEDNRAIGEQLVAAFVEAADRYPNRIDTTRIGLLGHSAGAGLLPSTTYRLVRGEGWGGSGAFIFSSAPWIDFDITDAMIADFPTEVKMIIQTYEDDQSTDLRTYIDPFESLPIPDDEKDFLTLRTTTVDGYTYAAVHSTIGTGNGYGHLDALDYEGVFRLLAALADYTFTGSEAGKTVALGNGVAAQIEMAGLRDLISTDDPRPIPGATYDYPCDIDDNPRREHCDDYDDELPAPILVAPVKHQVLIEEVSPRFVWEPSPTAEDYYLQVRPMLPNGEPDWTVSYGENLTAAEAGCASGEATCVYTLTASLPWGPYVWWGLPSNATHNGVWSRRGYFVLVARRLYLPLVTRH